MYSLWIIYPVKVPYCVTLKSHPLFFLWDFVINVSHHSWHTETVVTKKFVSGFSCSIGNIKCWHFLTVMNVVEMFKYKVLALSEKTLKICVFYCFFFFPLKDVITGRSPLLFRKLSNPDIFSSTGKAKLQRQLSQDDCKLRRGSLASSLSGKYLIFFFFWRLLGLCCQCLRVN